MTRTLQQTDGPAYCLNNNHSYVVVELATGDAVMEFFSAELTKHINTNKYKIMTAYEYLCELNTKLQSLNVDNLQ
jgi:hypothetical protein